MDEFTRGCHLRQNQEVERCGINLEMTPFRVPDDSFASGDTVFGMEGISRRLRVFESFNLLALLHHGEEETTH
jgi:hypothetical protein